MTLRMKSSPVLAKATAALALASALASCSTPQRHTPGIRGVVQTRVTERLYAHQTRFLGNNSTAPIVGFPGVPLLLYTIRKLDGHTQVVRTFGSFQVGDCIVAHMSQPNAEDPVKLNAVDRMESATGC